MAYVFVIPLTVPRYFCVTNMVTFSRAAKTQQQHKFDGSLKESPFPLYLTMLLATTLVNECLTLVSLKSAMNQPDNTSKSPLESLPTMAISDNSSAEDRVLAENKTVHWQSDEPSSFKAAPALAKEDHLPVRHKLLKRHRDQMEATASSAQDDVQLKLERIHRKIHLAAQYELVLLNKSRDLRAKRALLMHQYQTLSQRMPPGFVPAMMPPLYSEATTSNDAAFAAEVTPVHFKESVNDAGKGLPSIAEL